MAGTFGVIALGGPIANALVLPLLPVMIVVGGLGATLSAVHPALGWMLLQFASAGTSITTTVARLISAIPGAAIQIGSWPVAWSAAEGVGVVAALVVLVLRHAARNRDACERPRDRRRGHSRVSSPRARRGHSSSRPDGRLHVSVLNTGSSTAVLVRTADGSTVLVDGGSSPTQLLAALGRVMPPATNHLDMVVITGGERAAVDGLNGLPGHYSVGTVVSPGGLTAGGDTIVAALAGSARPSSTQTAPPGRSAERYGGASASRRSHGASDVRPGDRRPDRTRAGARRRRNRGPGRPVRRLRGRLAADLVVTPPGGAVSPVLLFTARPSELAVPLAQGAPGVAAPHGYTTDRTGADGDLDYTGGAFGLVEST